MSSSGQGKDSKPGSDQGATTFQVKAPCTVPPFTDVLAKQLLFNYTSELRGALSESKLLNLQSNIIYATPMYSASPTTETY